VSYAQAGNRGQENYVNWCGSKKMSFLIIKIINSHSTFIMA